MSDLSRNTIATAGTTKAIVTKTTTYTAGSTDDTILCDTTAGAFTINLPPGTPNTGRIYTIKKTNAAANAVTIDPSGAETIDGAATLGVVTQWASVIIQANGPAWFVLSAS